MAEGLRPPQVTEPETAIGRLPSRMPVIIRSHEGSAGKYARVLRGGDEMIVLFLRKIISHWY
jgi:hypothetical protein